MRLGSRRTLQSWAGREQAGPSHARRAGTLPALGLCPRTQPVHLHRVCLSRSRDRTVLFSRFPALNRVLGLWSMLSKHLLKISDWALGEWSAHLQPTVETRVVTCVQRSSRLETGWAGTGSMSLETLERVRHCRTTVQALGTHNGKGNGRENSSLSGSLQRALTESSHSSPFSPREAGKLGT